MNSNFQEIELYKSKDGEVRLDVQLEENNVWLSQQQMSLLFGRDRTVVSRHIRNVFKDGELNMDSNVQKMHITGNDKPTNIYSLDVVISVGYKVKSQRGTEFRIWATNTLRQHLIQGYTVNEKRLGQLKQSLKLVADISTRKELTGSEATALLQTVSQYEYALDLLDDYDHQRVILRNSTRTKADPVA